MSRARQCHVVHVASYEQSVTVSRARQRHVVHCRKFECDVHEKDQLVSLNRFKDNMINAACSNK